VKKQPIGIRAAALALTAALSLWPALAQAASGSATLTIQQVEIKKRTGWVSDSLTARAWLNVVGNSGAPFTSLSKDTLKVYEPGSSSSQKILRVDTLENMQTGAAIVLVVQASGAWLGIQEDVKKIVSAFINSLGEKDQIAVVDYAEQAELIAPFSADKGEVAGKAAKIKADGKSYLLYDGLAQAASLFTNSAGGKGGEKAATALPSAKAIIVISDGRDNGSGSSLEQVINEAKKRKVPIHAVGHTELDTESLKNLEEITKLTGGSYKAAQSVEDINKGLTSIKDYINHMWVVDWSTDLDHDGKDHKLEIAVEYDGGGPSLRGATTVKTPDYFNWKKLVLITVIVLLLILIALVVYVLTRPKPLPPRFCPVCKREQMPDWEICLFCLKAAKARLSVQKGAQKGKLYPLVGKVVSIGSGPETNIRLMDGAISGKHAGVAIDGNKFEIVDLNSKNGVLVNGKKTPRRFLRNGDIVTLGMTELKFESTVDTGGDEDGD
jgi:VWFA-related protein